MVPTRLQVFSAVFGFVDMLQRMNGFLYIIYLHMCKCMYAGAFFIHKLFWLYNKALQFKLLSVLCIFKVVISTNEAFLCFVKRAMFGRNQTLLYNLSNTYVHIIKVRNIVFTKYELL